MENQFKNKYFKYKNKYFKLREQIGGYNKFIVNSGDLAPKAGCYVYLAHPEGKRLSVQDGMPINKWYYDWYGENKNLSCDDDRKKKYQSDYKPEYGTLIVNVKQNEILPSLPNINNINGVIKNETLNKIIFYNIPDNFNKPELKSAIVWGALNRANSINGIKEVLRLKYITQNEKMKMGNPDADSCQFVKYYVKLSEDNTWVQNTKKTLGL